MGGGSSSPPQAPQFNTYGGQPNYIPTGQPGADTNLQNLQQQQYAAASTFPQQFLPQLNTATQGMINNPYASAAQDASNASAAYMSGTLAPMQQQNAQTLQNLGQQAVPYGQQILQTGFDPQQSLYNRTQQQLTDQLGAQNAMSGLSGTPYGAGVVGQGLSNFNIDWQNQQLQRQATAAQGYGALTNTIGKDLSGAADFGQAAAGTIAGAGAQPYGTSLGISGNQLGGLSALSQGTTAAYALPQQLIGDYQKYLNLGNQASGTTDSAINSAYSNSLQAWQAQQAANQSLFGNIGTLAGGIEGLFSPGGANPAGALAGGGPGGAGGLFDLSTLFGP